MSVLSKPDVFCIILFIVTGLEVQAQTFRPATDFRMADIAVLEAPGDPVADSAQVTDLPKLVFRNTMLTPRVPPRHHGIFCRIESQLEKKTGVAPRFRLGNTEYVNKLEGKENLSPGQVIPHR